MKKWTPQGRKPTFHVPIILPTATHVWHKLLVSRKLIHEQLCPLPPQKKTKKQKINYFILFYFIFFKN